MFGFFSRVWKSMFLTIFLFCYCFLIIIHLIHPKGIIKSTIVMFKDIRKMKANINLDKQKYNYYRWLVMGYRGKDKDAIALITFKKFKKVVHGYKLIKSKKETVQK